MNGTAIAEGITATDIQGQNGGLPREMTAPAKDKPPGTSRATGGRPNKAASARLREVLVETALATFLEFGYAAASIEQIAARAKVSKRTLYARFPDKQALFAAVVHELNNRWSEPIFSSDQTSLAQQLKTAAAAHYARALHPDSVALYRMLLTEVSRYPELAKLLARDLEQRGPSYIEQTLRACLEDGRLARTPERDRPQWPKEMSQMIVGALTAEPRRRTLLGEGPLSPEEMDIWIDKVIGTFMTALQA